MRHANPNDDFGTQKCVSVRYNLQPCVRAGGTSTASEELVAMSENTPKPDFSDVVLVYEKAIATHKPSEWFEKTIEALDGATRACQPLGLAERGIGSAAIEHWYTRLAAALTTYIAHPQIAVNIEQLSNLSARKQTIAYIFNASGYRTMSHLLAIVDTGAGKEGINVPAAKAPILLAVIGLDDVPPELMTVALKQPPELLLVLMLGWLNQRCVLTAQGNQNRSRLLQSGHLVEHLTITDADIGNIVNAWMYSTYADDQDRHNVKTAFNKLMLRLLGDLPTQLSLTPVNRPRPRVVVIHERFIAQHAMFRCYAPLIRGLSKHFEIVAVAEEGTIDQASDEIFDNKIVFPAAGKNIRTITKLITDQQPDIVYYPSLGMSHWTVLLAQLRLAPVQVMTHGHPATSMSPEIDYVYLNEIEGDLAAQHSERVLVGPRELAFQAHSELPASLPKLAQPSDREVRVAVNSKVMKLSPRLIDVCKRLHDGSEKPIRFSFFPGERQLLFDGLSAAIRRHLPSADVIPYVDYPEFLAEMARCDLALAAFPFGNTNSTVDTSLLGLPTVVWCGQDSSSQTDSLVIAAAGLSNWLVCHSDEQYYETALSLINDPAKRLAAMGGMDRSTVRSNLMGAPTHDTDESFSDMVWEVYMRHDKIQASEQRVFHHNEWLDS